MFRSSSKCPQCRLLKSGSDKRSLPLDLGVPAFSPKASRISSRTPELLFLTCQSLREDQRQHPLLPHQVLHLLHRPPNLSFLRQIPTNSVSIELTQPSPPQIQKPNKPYPTYVIYLLAHNKLDHLRYRGGKASESHLTLPAITFTIHFGMRRPSVLRTGFTAARI
jgi:hypothetical protein